MVSSPSIDPMLLQRTTPNHLPGRLGASPMLPPPPSNCSPAARSTSPRHHLSAPLPFPSPSRRRTLRSGNSPAALATAPSTPTPRPRQTSPCSHSLRLGETTCSVPFPLQWGDDDNIVDTTPPTNHLSCEDDAFLDTFADHEFSSPSSYPSLTANFAPADAPAPPLDDAPAPCASRPHQTAASAAPLRRTPAGNRASAPPLPSTTQLSSSTREESQPTPSSNEDWDEPLSQGSSGSFPDMTQPPPPPPPTRLHQLLNGFNVASFYKLPSSRTSDVSPRNATTESSQGPFVLEDDVFGDGTPPRGPHPVDDHDLTTIDLTEANDVPDSLQKPEPPKEDKTIKISKFQCVICMDDASNLTVTHCGHLYCAQCLHSSLHVEATKNKCPMCRAKIDVKSRATYNTKTKGFWPLELKLMTATRKGKRKAGNIS